MGKLEDSDILTLSNKQQKIVSLMLSKNLYLVTTEGEKVSCWLECHDGHRFMNLRKDTANILFTKKVIEYDNALSNLKSRGRTYYYILSTDFLAKIEILRARKRIHW